MVENNHRQHRSRAGNKKSLVSIIVPCYNEEEGIRGTVERLLNEVREDDSYSYEFVFVDDHSTDTTPDTLLEVGESVKNLKVIRLGSNSGSHVACRAGLNYCDGDVAVFLTADLQEGPELIPGMLRLWNEGIDVVSTIAEKRDRESFLSNAFAKLYYFLVKHTGDLGYVRDVRASPRLLDRKVIERYCQLRTARR